MQRPNSCSKINLSENYPARDFTNLGKVFPQLKNIINKQIDSEILSPNPPVIVDKFVFYQMILEKIKSYFELKETFIISDSIGIILNDLKDIIVNTNNIQTIKNNVNKKVEFPLINKMKKPILKSYLYEAPKTCRHNSSKSSGSKGSKKTNNSKSPNSVNSFFYDEPYSGKINYVYLNLDKNEKKSSKNVHFALTYTSEANKNLNKKSNLKKTNIKKEFNKTISFKLNDINYNTSNENLMLKSKTGYPIRNKSNGIKLKETSKSKEKKENYDTPNTKIINSLYETNLNLLFNIDDKDFNIFEFEKQVGKENTLPLVGKYIFDSFNYGEIINKTKYINWCKKISEGYNRNNSYHTDLHAADIAHTSYIYFKVGLINDIIKLDNISTLSLFLSCICHDYKHPGRNNNYLIETNNSIAINYNDISVLENMHISETFKLIHSNQDCNIFENLEKNDYKKIRKQMISCVLKTDMSFHKETLDFMNKYLTDKESTEKNNQDFMNLIIHSADISNPTKTFNIYYKWAELVVEEFYLQGDKEKELGLNCSCDRNKISLYKSQLGFIDYIEIPFYGLFTKIFPKLNFLMDNLNNNRERIKLLEDEDNKNKNKEEKN